jgi:hypothetical protein
LGSPLRFRFIANETVFLMKISGLQRAGRSATITGRTGREFWGPTPTQVTTGEASHFGSVQPVLSVAGDTTSIK